MVEKTSPQLTAAAHACHLFRAADHAFAIGLRIGLGILLSGVEGALDIGTIAVPSVAAPWTHSLSGLPYCARLLVAYCLLLSFGFLDTINIVSYVYI